MKKNFTITEMPYLTRQELIEIADKGVEWDYNRQLCSEKIQRLPVHPEIVYPVEHHFLHEHRCLELCEMHMRLVITIPGSIATADVPLSYFESLPKARCIVCRDQIVAVLLTKVDGSPRRLRFHEMNRDTRRAICHLMRKSKDRRTIDFLASHTNVMASHIC